ncbi:MAG TPA: helix-turn-helix domain-containing protein [Chloroflexota bacterium]
MRAVSTWQDVDTYRLLMEQIIAGNGLPAVTRLLSDLVALPATVADEEFEPLHAFAPRGRHLSTEEAALAPSTRAKVVFDIDRAPRASTAPPTARVRGTEGEEFAISPIVLPSGIVGYVWVADPSGHVSDTAEEGVAQAAAACAMEMVRQRAIIEGESRVRNSFLEDLLTGNVTSVSATRRRARYLGYDVRGEQVVFVLDMDGFSSYIDRHKMDERGIQQLKERFRRSVDASAPAIWSKTLVWEHSDSMVVLAPVAKDLDPQALRRRVEMLRGGVEKRLAGPSISAGIGRPCGELSKLQHSYKEAEHALRIGTAFSGPSSTAAFDDLGAYRLLFHLRDQPELRTFCEETVGALENYDEQHKSHLVDTLAAFLDLQGNISETARSLHLHRNGLLYRLSRIEKIAGCDLGNSAQRLALQLALLARPLLRRERGGVPRAPRGERG